ncbi:GATA transcription factor-like protein [Quillaja saponaria]|uniref:GATA transcription factor-like protein n=1 Tax=Quillaja saponaria TaxID=32244 RepID=A0AAD7Q1C9_QUISA|nr:GATA transcription factor-like protein [Quillaja saponaria]
MALQAVATSRDINTCRKDMNAPESTTQFLLYQLVPFLVCSSFEQQQLGQEHKSSELKKLNNMQSRLAATVTRSSGLINSLLNQALRRRFCASSTSKPRTADPAIHSGEHEAGPSVHTNEPLGIKNAAEDRVTLQETGKQTSRETDPLETPKPPYPSSTRLKSTGVNRPLDPMTQQKRKHGSITLEDVSCAGVDGSPWPEEKHREEQHKDEQEYYKHHKASPLSEIEFADTRKPITRATDGTADSPDYGGGKDVIGWRPEQLDTAEEALRRAAEIFKQNAMRGDPDAPQSRVLRALRGETF